MLAFCEYPIYDFRTTRHGGSWRVGGDPGGTCIVRVIPSGASAAARSISVSVRAGSVAVPVHGTLSAEGHALFELRGGQAIEIRCERSSPPADGAIIIGAMAATGAH